MSTPIAAKEPAFSIGIEEEYLLVSRETRDLVVDPPADLLDDCAGSPAGSVSPEFLRSQIEVGTRVCKSVRDARDSLAEMRGVVSQAAGRHGLAPIAASTHPFAQWSEQRHTEKERYTILARDLQGVARRLLICGTHVHVGIEDPDLRIDLMAQVAYFLPHLLALSTSSPFWRGVDTGLKSYRISVFNELPRTGLPEHFQSWGEYQRHVNVLVSAGLIEDGSKLWWDVRPSARFDTLEMRITDVCTNVDDAAAIAALYACVLRMLWRLRRTNQRWRLYAHMLVMENRWRAQRYGFDEGLVDFGKGCTVPYAELLDELLDLTAEDAVALDCEKEVAHCRHILTRGTSAHRQLAAFRAATSAGASQEDALRQVVDFLIAETVAGVDVPA
ncbi:carboxylate-amine ligase [Caenispirillum salinarum]|uniref:carboxylate-amine ligase n=1 Tax=Caenispirillum salinarum TaxID=859058 RepID=UPI00384B940C